MFYLSMHLLNQSISGFALQVALKRGELNLSGDVSEIQNQAIIEITLLHLIHTLAYIISGGHPRPLSHSLCCHQGMILRPVRDKNGY